LSREMVTVRSSLTAERIRERKSWDIAISTVWSGSSMDLPLPLSAWCADGLGPGLAAGTAGLTGAGAGLETGWDDGAPLPLVSGFENRLFSAPKNRKLVLCDVALMIDSSGSGRLNGSSCLPSRFPLAGTSNCEQGYNDVSLKYDSSVQHRLTV
jgi:hypothetical protein